jgi:hypothetical protein
MENRYKKIIAAGLVLFAVILFIDFSVYQDLYFSGIVLMILAVIGMSLFIMQDATSLPEIGVSLMEDAKGVVVINRGNDRAFRIHVALVPLNTEFDIGSLEADGRYSHALPSMLTEAKAVVTYRNAKGEEYSRTIMLSALGKSDDDLLKPVFPIFKWN